MKTKTLRLFCIIINLILILSFQCLSKGPAQKLTQNDISKKLSAGNAGKDFWFTFIPIHKDKYTKIFVSSDVETLVTVEIPGRGYIERKKTIPNDIIMFSISAEMAESDFRFDDYIEPVPEHVNIGAGVHVYADDPVICYGMTRFNLSEGFLAIPTSLLGNEYICASWADAEGYYHEYFPSYIGITSAFDNNKVSFTLGGETFNKTAGGQLPGETRNYNLNKGDVLLIPGSGYSTDLSGSRVISTKPVSLVDGNFLASVPEYKWQANFLTEMELPTNTWGKHFLITPIYGKKKNSIIKMFIKEANTHLYRDGQEIVCLKNTGGLENESWYRMRADEGITRPIVISGDKPISVTQYNTGFNDDSSAGFPFQMLITPFEQYQKEIVFNTPGTKSGGGFTANYINLVYCGNDDGTIPDNLEFATVYNGQFVWKRVNTFSSTPGLPFKINVNGHKYYSKTMLLPGDGVYSIRANDPICAYEYGSTNYAMYGFPASLSANDLEKNDTLAPIPSYMVYCDGFAGSTDGLKKDAIVEDMPKNKNHSNLSMINFHTAESFNYNFKYLDFIPGETSLTQWHASVIDPTQDAKCVITFSDRCGNDTTIEIVYKAPMFNIKPDKIDFGLIPKDSVPSTDVWFFNQSLNYDNRIMQLNFKSNDKGFNILDTNFNPIEYPMIIKSNDSIRCKLVFKPSNEGEFHDSLGIVDTCTMITKYFIKVQVQVGGPVIDVKDFDYKINKVGTTFTAQTNIYNRGITNLEIYGYNGPFSNVFIPELPQISLTNPLVIIPGGIYSFNIIFSPDTVRDYQDSIIFFSNAKGTDSVCVLNGSGVRNVAVDENLNSVESQLQIVPNPVSNNLTISWNNEFIPERIVIADILGNVMDDISINQNISGNSFLLNTSRYTDDLYVMKVISKNEILFRRFCVIK